MKFLKSCAVLAVVLAALCLLFVPAQAAEIVASGNCGADGSNVTWTLDADGLLTISGTGAMVNDADGGLGWLTLRDSIKQVVIQPGVTNISDGAFMYCDSLTSVSIPDSVTYIEQYAFCGCSMLNTLDLPNSITAIGESAFEYSGISSIVIPEGVTTISTLMFSDCTKLTSVSIPNTVTSIESSAFWNCYRLEEVIIPDSVTSLGNSVFYNCTNIKYVYIGKGISKITTNTFNYCYGVEKYEVSPESPYYCSDAYGVLFSKDMTELVKAPAVMTGIYYVPNGVVTIGDMAFYRNYSLTGVVLSDSVRTIGGWSLGGNHMTQITLNEGLATITDSAFYYAEKLESLEIPGTVQSIGEYAFSYCNALKTVTICEGVTAMPNYMFENCPALEEVAIPASMLSLGRSIFYQCPSITSIRYGGSQQQWSLIVNSASGIGSNVTILTHVHSFSGNACTQCGVLGGSLSQPENQLIWAVYHNSTLSIEGEGALPDYSAASHAPWYSKREAIVQVVFDSSVTGIGDYAFYGMENITGVTFSDQISYIGDYAFYGCEGWNGIVVPDGAVTIGDYAYANCTTAYNLTIGANLSVIGKHAFANCPRLKNIYVDSENLYYIRYETDHHVLYTKDMTTLVLHPQGQTGTYTVATYTVPYGVTTIADYAFSACDGLTSITLPDTVTSIGEGAFSNCSQLASVRYAGTKEQLGSVSVANNAFLTNDTFIPMHSHEHVFSNKICTDCGMRGGEFGTEGDNLIWMLDNYGFLHISGTGSMGDYASHDWPWYGYRNNIKRVVIDSGVTYIGRYAFSDEDNLTSVSIPDSLTAVGYGAFSGCNELQYTVYGHCGYLGNAENPFLAVRATYTDSYDSVTSVEIHPSAKYILGVPFSNFKKLETVHIPASVVFIDSTAFSGCKNLSGFVVDADNAFFCNDDIGALLNKNMTALIKVPVGTIVSYTVPDSVTTIVSSAFGYATKLTSVYVGTNLQVIEAHAFTSCSGHTVYYTGTTQQWTEVERDWYYGVNGTVVYNYFQILSQPQDQAVEEGTQAQLKVEMYGDGLTYQWQYSTNNGKTWRDSSSATAGHNTDTLTVVATAARNGFLYRCKITNTAGTTVITNAAQLSLDIPLVVVSQPASETVKYGSSAVFAVEATGIGLTYQWQYSMNGGKTWFNSTVAGYDTAALTVVGSPSRDGFLYRCRIIDSKGEKLYSEAATLSVDTSAMPKFTAQPVSQTVTAGSKTVFAAACTGEYTRVYWQYSIDGGRSWYASSFLGCESDTLTVECKGFRDGFMYRCVLIDAYGNRTESNAATLTVN